MHYVVVYFFVLACSWWVLVIVLGANVDYRHFIGPNWTKTQWNSEKLWSRGCLDLPYCCGLLGILLSRWRTKILMDFKRGLHDPSGRLKTWNGSTSYCNWEGINVIPQSTHSIGSLQSFWQQSGKGFAEFKQWCCLWVSINHENYTVPFRTSYYR